MIIENGSTPTIVFLLVDKEDHVSPVTSGKPTAWISKNGSDFRAASGTIIEISAGWYRFVLTPAETDVDGPLIVRVSEDDAHEWRDIHQVYSSFTTQLAATMFNQIADHVLRRDFVEAAASAVGDEKSFRSLLGAVAKDVNRVELSGTTLSIYEADDETVLGTQSVVTNNTTRITGLQTESDTT